jgi:hypothetical protein
MKEMGAHRGGVCYCMHGEGAQEQRVKCLQECEVWLYVTCEIAMQNACTRPTQQTTVLANLQDEAQKPVGDGETIQRLGQTGAIM